MKRVFLFVALLFLASCASPYKNIQPQINALVVAQHFDKALSFLDDPSVYGKHNELLYWLDKGMTAHLAGQYEMSIHAFERAKAKYEELYTRSISQSAATWIANDYSEDYRGEDHEYVLVNVFQALNFATLGNIEEALVEARAVDQKLNIINGRYKKDQKNVYSDDAFARFLEGVLYAAERTSASLNDAHIANSRAMDVYAKNYETNYQIKAPRALKDNLKMTREFMDEGLYSADDQAHVYLFEYTGFVPLKVADSFILPLDYTHVTKISFPRHVDRFAEVKSSRLTAVISLDVQINQDTELAEGIGAIAKRILDNRKFLIGLKAGLRPLLKYGLEKTAESQVRGKYGDWPADVLNVISNVYNLSTEEADLRSWQTLPNEIRVAHMSMKEGTYEFFVEDFDENKVSLERRSLGQITIKAGETKFLISRGFR